MKKILLMTLFLSQICYAGLLNYETIKIPFGTLKCEKKIMQDKKNNLFIYCADKSIKAPIIKGCLRKESEDSSYYREKWDAGYVSYMPALKGNIVNHVLKEHLFDESTTYFVSDIPNNDKTMKYAIIQKYRSTLFSNEHDEIIFLADKENRYKFSSLINNCSIPQR